MFDIGLVGEASPLIAETLTLIALPVEAGCMPASVIGPLLGLSTELSSTAPEIFSPKQLLAQEVLVASPERLIGPLKLLNREVAPVAILLISAPISVPLPRIFIPPPLVSRVESMMETPSPAVPSPVRLIAPVWPDPPAVNSFELAMEIPEELPFPLISIVPPLVLISVALIVTPLLVDADV